MHILIPTVFFPPILSPGAFRLRHFVKRFVELGGRVTVVTVSLEDFEAGFPRPNTCDAQLLEGMPPEVRIVRTRALRSGKYVNWLNRARLGRLYSMTCTPDNARRWVRVAVDACREVIAQTPVDCIYTSSNPLSVHLVGEQIARSTGLPWVAEFRDPWTTNPSKSWQTRFHYYGERHKEAQVLRGTTKIIMNTPVARQQLLDSHRWLDPNKVDVITNGFDPEAMSRVRDLSTSDDRDPARMLIAHVGTMRAIRPRRAVAVSLRRRVFRALNSVGHYRLGTMESLGNSPWYLCQAMHKVVGQHPEWRGNLKLVIAGRMATSLERELDEMLWEMGLADVVQHLGTIPYNEAMELMRSANVLLVNQEFTADGKPSPIVPAKTYEYLAMGKPILGLLPPGDTREFVGKSGWGFLAPPDDPDAIAQVLTRLYQAHISGGIEGETNWTFVNQFRSDVLADRVWEICRCAVTKEDHISSASLSV